MDWWGGGGGSSLQSIRHIELCLHFFSFLEKDRRGSGSGHSPVLNNGSNLGGGGNGNFNRMRGNGRPFEQHHQDRRSFDAGRGGNGGGRRFEDGRGDAGMYRGGPQQQRGGGGGRFVNDNRGPRGKIMADF